MIFARRLRFLAALLALASVLFAQLAIAAYACPIAAGLAQEASAGEGGCCGKAMDPEQPALCAAHCQQGDQSLDKPSASLPGLGPWLPVSAPPGILDAAERPRPPGELASLLARDTAPAAAVRHCRLRF